MCPEATLQSLTVTIKASLLNQPPPKSMSSKGEGVLCAPPYAVCAPLHLAVMGRGSEIVANAIILYSKGEES
jgi:hypothetical protein